LKKRTAWILVAAVAAVAVGAAAVGAVALLFRGDGAGLGLGKAKLLTLRLEGDVPEQSAADIGALFEQRPTSLRTIVESLDRAARDAQISGAIVRVGPLPEAGWARIQELRAAIARFRAAGKPAYAHVEYCGNKEYYLATACSKVYALPTAILDVSGLSLEFLFMRGTLDRLGVEAEFEGVGRYKNAPNQFTERGFTAPHREQMEAIADSLYGEYVSVLAKARSKTPDEVRALLDRGPYDAKEALRAGLVDELLYRDQVEEKVEGPATITPGRYLRGTRSFFDGRPKLALVYAVGEIVSGASQTGPFGGSYAGSDTVAAALRQAREDGSVRAIVLRVDSPGGFGPAADVIWREVRQVRKEKPIVVSMGDYAASGGYYIAMGADAIVAQPGTLTGSIGVFSGKFNLRGLYEKLGLSKDTVSRGRNAAIYTDYRRWTDSERERIRAMNRAFYEDFLSRAAEGRALSRDAVEAVAEGRVWTGSEAVAHRLADRLGGLREAVALAKEKAKIPAADEVSLAVLPAPKGLIETLFEHQEEANIEMRMAAELRAALGWAARLRGEGPMARLPYDVRVR
jgi:protease-4